jgi:hypothetical protein
VAADTTLASVGVQGVQLKLKASYSALLKDMILPYPQDRSNPKLLARFFRTLDDERTHSILVLIWQASEPVSRYPSAAGGLRRDKDGHLTSYGLAVQLATSPGEVSKINSRIRKIGIAAAAYGLVERIDIRKTKVNLEGTPLLHEFILKLSGISAAAILELIPRLKPPEPSIESPPSIGVRRGEK